MRTMGPQLPSTNRKALLIKPALVASLLLNAILLPLGTAAAYRHVVNRRSSGPNSAVNEVVRSALFEEIARRGEHFSVVFLGDSHVEYGEWSELLGIPVANRGIAGDTSSDVLERLDPVLTLHPKAIFLMVGTNDALRGVAETAFAQNYQKILERVRLANPGTKVYAQSIPPVGSSYGSEVRALSGDNGDRVNASVIAFNKQIRSLCDGSSVVYVDLFAIMQKNGELNPDYTHGGVHLNGRGYEVWKEKILELQPRDFSQIDAAPRSPFSPRSAPIKSSQSTTTGGS